MTVREIIKKVFSDAGFSDFRFELRGDYPKIEYCVQYRETDFVFVSRLMEREGMYYSFTHQKNCHTLVICDNLSSHKPAKNFEILSFIGGGAVTDREGVISSWEVSREIKPGAFAHNDYNFLSPSPDPNLRLLSRSSAPSAQKPKPLEIYDNHGGFGETKQGERYARIRMEELLADRDVATASTNIQGIEAGRTFKLAKHPTRRHNRAYLVTTVKWSAQEGAYGSGGGGVEEFFTCSFTCIPDDRPFRPARITPLPRIEGPQTATVVGPKGQEIHVDEHARVKVQFHWDRYGKSDSGSSCWIRVSQPWAGAGFGGMAIPRIGQEVILEFIEADPDRPIITGRVYNGKNMPNASNAGRDGKPGNSKPKDLTQAAMMTSIKSNSLGGSGGSNEITMNDTGGAEGLFIKAQKDEIHKVGNDREDEVGNDEKRKVGNNRTREVAVDESVTVGANRSVTVGVNHTETIGVNQTITVGSNKSESVGIMSTESVGAAKLLNIGAAYTVSVGAAMAVSVGGAMAITVGAASITNVAGNYTLNAKKISLEAQDEVSIKVGGAQIVMKKNGDISIKGSSNIKIKGKKIEQN